ERASQDRLVSGSGQRDPGGGKGESALYQANELGMNAIAKVPNTLSPGALSDGAAGVLVENVAARAHHAAASSLSIWLSQPKRHLAAQAPHRAPCGCLKLFANRLLKVKADLDSSGFHHLLPP